MAKTETTVKGYVYTVTSPNGGTVTDAEGKLNKPVAAGDQVTVQAPSDSLTCDDDDAVIYKTNFKTPLLALRLLGQGGNALPAGYTLVEFLENTGTQYLALPVEYGQTSGLAVSYKVKPYSWYSFLSIIRYSGKSVQIGRIYADGNTGIATSSPTVSVFVANNGKITTAYNEYESNKIRVASQGEEKETACPHAPDAGESVTPVYLFAYDSSANLGAYTPSKAYYSLYEARFTQGKRLAHQYVPALTPAGEPCMYDLVTREPLKNAGSGQFVAGMTLAQVRGLRLPAGGGKLTLALPHEASIDRLAQAALERARANGWELTLQYAEADVPAGYRRLDFLESTGTQRIDTGVKLSSESEVRCEYMAMESTPKDASIYGSGDASGRFYMNGRFSDYQFVFYCWSKKNRLKTWGLTTVIYGKRFKVRQNYNEVEVDGKIASMPEAEDSGFECSQTASLFRGVGNSPVARIYSFSISRAGVAQVDYVPCIAPDGKPGMYNKVDGTVKENAGSGAFIAGLATVDDVRKLWLPEISGELTVSVPHDTPDSAEEQLRKNNPTWQIAIQYRTENNEN